MKNLARILSLLFLGACRTYQGPVTDHFDGKTFHNPWLEQKTTFFDLLKWKLFETAKDWPSWVENPKDPQIPEVYRSGNVSVTFVNHASFLIQIGGLNILTDPVWSERVSPFTFIGPKRVRDPGIPFAKLPRIDAVLVSHNHYDHMDLPTLQNLSKRDKPRIFVPLGDKEWLEDNEVQNLQELDWWDHKDLNTEVTIHFAPAQHWSSRGLQDRNRSLWGSFAIEYRGKYLYFAGDTGYGPHFTQAAERFSPIELAVLPIGAYEPRWFMQYQHMNPPDTYLAYHDLKAKRGMGMHFGCWQLTDEGIDEPKDHIKMEFDAKDIPPEEFVVPEVGGTYRYTF